MRLRLRQRSGAGRQGGEGRTVQPAWQPPLPTVESPLPVYGQDRSSKLVWAAIAVIAVIVILVLAAL